MLSLLLWSTLAHAGLDEVSVAQTIQDLQASTRSRLLIGAVGPEAEKAIERVLKTNPGLDVTVVRIPTAGDPVRELWRALDTHGLSCALRVSPDGPRSWAVTPFGNCTPQTSTPAVVAAPGTPPAEADEVTVSTSTPAPITVEVPTAVLANRYLSQRLEVGGTNPREPDAWRVQDGEGKQLSAPAFASLIGDGDTTALLLQEQQKALKATSWLRIGGGLVAASAIAPLVNMPEDASAQEDRLWSSLFLASTGMLSVLIAPRAVDAVNARQRGPDNYYPREQADTLVASYNTTLQSTLGLTTDDLSPPAEDDAEAEPATELAPQPEEGTP